MDAKESKKQLAALLEEKARREKYNRFSSFFPDEGPFRRELYQKHCDFFKGGKKFKERAFIAANRVGKTVAGGFELTCHLTGLYPDWWEGKEFDRPVSVWVVGKSMAATANVLQHELCGPYGDLGAGMIPKHLIAKTRLWPGVTGVYQDVFVRHISGGLSHVQFKNMEQDVGTYMGTAKDIIWFDEECDNKMIYDECLTRTMTTGGMVYTTFTPLSGLSEIVLSFLPGGKFPQDGITKNDEGKELNKFIVNCDWDDVPHLRQEDKEILLSSYLPHQREARAKGIPALGSGAIYPILEDNIKVDRFEIPIWWPRAFGMDFGWNCTACIWGAKDPDTGIIYLYSEHYKGQVTPQTHAYAIKARGDWILAAVDPAGGGSGRDGKSFIDDYSELGILMMQANNAVEAGIMKVLGMLESGQLKVFSDLHNFFDEYRLYRRDEDGKVVKKNDHLMDALRYLTMHFEEIAQLPPDEGRGYSESYHSKGNEVTGY